MDYQKYIYWQDGDMWLGYLERYPDYWTQGETQEELQENLRYLYGELTGDHIPCVERLRAAAHRRVEEQQRSHPFESPANLEGFFRACDALEGPKREPDWQEHLAVIDESRKRLSNS